MFAPNLVYATVQGMFPRVLADDGVNEALVLPYSVDSTVQFEFYDESGNLQSSPIDYAKYYPQGGGEINLPVFLIQVTFPATLEPGVCVIGLPSLQAYPFRVLRAGG